MAPGPAISGMASGNADEVAGVMGGAIGRIEILPDPLALAHHVAECGDLMLRTVETRHRAMHIGSVGSIAVLLWAGHSAIR